MENLRGILLMTLAMATFALCDMFIVLASDSLPPGQIMVIFGAFGTIILGTYATWNGVDLLSRDFFLRPVLFRNFCEAWATIAVVMALAFLPFSLFSAVIQANPLLVTLGAAMFLRETVGWRRWLAIVIGLVGVVLILEPWSASTENRAYLLLAVIAVMGMSARDLSTRFVPRSVPTQLLACYGIFSATIGGLVLMLISGDTAPVDLRSALYLLVGAGFGTVAYVAITAAMRSGDISVVTPFRYTRLIFAFLIAAIVFGEQPGPLTWIGAAIVIATGLYTLIRQARINRIKG